jgi:hypothetical protein
MQMIFVTNRIVKLLGSRKWAKGLTCRTVLDENDRKVVQYPECSVMEMMLVVVANLMLMVMWVAMMTVFTIFCKLSWF